MKRFFTFLTVTLALLAISSCEKTGKDEPEDETLEVNETNLKGTWEGGLEHDFAQGYPQRWRIEFDGQNYTTWHTYQTMGSINDDVQGLKTVGDKEKGTWTYADGVLILTPKEQFASHFQVMNPDYSLGGYTYYEYNEKTMEAAQWYVTSQDLIESGIERDIAEGTEWYISKWRNVALTKTTLTIKINRDTFVLEKQ